MCFRNIAIHQKPHTVLRRPAVQMRTVFGGAPCLKLSVDGYTWNEQNMYFLALQLAACNGDSNNNKAQAKTLRNSGITDYQKENYATVCTGGASETHENTALSRLDISAWQWCYRQPDTGICPILTSGGQRRHYLAILARLSL